MKQGLSGLDAINVIAEIYCRVHNSDIWSGDDGYVKMNMEHIKNPDAFKDGLNELIEKWITAIAGLTRVTPDDIEIISQEEYLSNIEYDENGKPNDINIHFETEPSSTAEGNNKTSNWADKWLSHTFSSNAEAGNDYRQFEKDAEIDLKKQAGAADCDICKFLRGHYAFSAVLKHRPDGKFVYVSIRDVRDGPEWYNNVLYRTMEHDSDWIGGWNKYCIWNELPSAIDKLNKDRI